MQHAGLDRRADRDHLVRVDAAVRLFAEELLHRLDHLRHARHAADEDKKRKAAVEAKNHAEALVHSTEKALSEHGSKIGEGDRRTIENAMADLKEALKGDNAEAISAKANTLAQASMKLGEAMYKQAEGAGAAPGGEPGGAGEAKKDDVVDAEFTEVDDDKKNKRSA